MEPIQQTYQMPTADQQLLDNGQGVIDPDVFFELNTPPSNLADFESKLTAFVDYHQKKNTRLVFITVRRNPLFVCNFLHRTHVFVWIIERRDNGAFGKPNRPVYR
jgi:hypothetical protein